MTSVWLSRTSVRLMIGVLGLALSGCDYWPPALQAQIEQLRSEAQAAAEERARFENELREANKQKEQLMARVDELTRSNQTLSAQLSKLEQMLAAEREKLKAAKIAQAKASQATKGTSKKKPAKPSAKKRSELARRGRG